MQGAHEYENQEIHLNPQGIAFRQTTNDAPVGISEYGSEKGSLRLHLCRIRALRGWRPRCIYLSRLVGLERSGSGAMTNNHVIIRLQSNDILEKER